VVALYLVVDVQPDVVVPGTVVPGVDITPEIFTVTLSETVLLVNESRQEIAKVVGVVTLYVAKPIRGLAPGQVLVPPEPVQVKVEGRYGPADQVMFTLFEVAPEILIDSSRPLAVKLTLRDTGLLCVLVVVGLELIEDGEVVAELGEVVPESIK